MKNIMFLSSPNHYFIFHIISHFLYLISYFSLFLQQHLSNKLGCVLPTENEEADNSQQGPENEGETCCPQPLRCQRRKTQGRWENSHHLREGDTFLVDSPDPSHRAACCPICKGCPLLNYRKRIKWLEGYCFCKKKKYIYGKVVTWWCSLFLFFFFCTNLDNPVLISFNILTKAAVSHSFLTLISALWHSVLWINLCWCPLSTGQAGV